MLRYSAAMRLNIAWLFLAMRIYFSTAQVPSSDLPDIKMDNRVVLQDNGDFVLLYKAEIDKIIFEIQVATDGYVGFGFSPKGDMTDADIYLGWIDGNGQIYAQDRYGVGFTVPLIDDSQDYELIGGYKNGSHTVLRFSRPWVTEDSENDLSLKGDPYQVIWAYGSDVISSPDQVLKYHASRGHRPMNLYDPVKIEAGSLAPMMMDNRVVLDNIGAFVLLWKEEVDEVILEIQVAATEGYVGLGFSADGEMTGADIFMGWIDESGEIFAQDRHATGDFEPIVDDSQDYKLLGGYKNDTHTVLRFSRLWDTGDDTHDYPILEKPYEVIWAYGQQMISSPEQALSYHGRSFRGHKPMSLQTMSTNPNKKAGLLPPMKMDHRVVLDKDGAFVLLWRKDIEEIIFEVQVATVGYVGLGFSPDGEMAGSDIFMGWICDLGIISSQDRYAVGDSVPLVDKSQDFMLLGGYRNGSHTVLRFSRYWNTGDQEHDYPIKEDPYQVIWAYGREVISSPHALKYHGRDDRGHRPLSLYNYDPNQAIGSSESNESGGSSDESRIQPRSLLPFKKMDSRVVLDKEGDFVLLWRDRKKYVIFEVQVATEGYIGVGFSSDGRMKGSDMFMGWIDTNGKIHAKDYYSLGHSVPIADPSQDYKILGGYRNGTHTVIRFSRPWITCDQKHDYQLKEDTVKLIWAYGLKPISSEKDLKKHSHDRRGYMSLYLKGAKRGAQPDLKDVKHWDIRAADIEIPSSDSDHFEWCQIRMAPKFNEEKKHHLIGYSPLVSEEQFPFLHRITLYECDMEQSDTHLKGGIGHKGVQCHASSMPPSWKACNAALIVWTHGNKGYEMYPEHVGFPIGEKYSGAKYFMLEIQYDTTQLKKGIVDDSGLRLYLTDKPRRYDAGVMKLGHTISPKMIIPPRSKWKSVAHCPSECTKKAIPDKGIMGFGAIMHTHMLGRIIKCQKIRDGRELSTFIEDKNYDFHSQNLKYFSEEIMIKPGDHLKTSCYYDARQKHKPTFGGSGSNEETCLLFVLYYPRIPFSSCQSESKLESILDAFGAKQVSIVGRSRPLKQEYLNEKFFRKFRNFLQSKDNRHHFTKGQLDNYFRLIKVLSPSALRGKSFYDITTDPSVYTSHLFIRLLKEMNSSYTFTCLKKGSAGYEGVPAEARAPSFTPYEAPPTVCTKNE